ncbi:MAG: TAXI family TRAP transporter solute-binding subunit [Deltaproteobacteria bacterium]|nr:TAXI family TRAP transporter solute-binding subunit [Deltaproteobacteria bacterium]
MRKAVFFLLIGLWLGISVFGFFGTNASWAGEVRFIKIATGNPAGRWYPFGAKLAELINTRIKNGPNASVTAGGGVSNCKAVDKNEVQLAITYGATSYNAAVGKPPFKKRLKNIRGLGIIELSYYNAVVRRDGGIKSFADLRNKKIAAGRPGFFSAVTTENVLKAYGLSFDEIRKSGGTVSNVSWSDAAEMMKDRNIDFIGVLTGIPHHTILSLTTAVKINLLSIDKEHQKIILENEPGYLIKVIPANTYPGVTRDTVTLSTDTQFICNKDLPDDLVYQITKLFYEEVPKFKEAFKQFGEVDYRRGYADIKVPMHPGAKRYFDEKLK